MLKECYRLNQKKQLGTKLKKENNAKNNV
jgi:hypothetical protein